MAIADADADADVVCDELDMVDAALDGALAKALGSLSRAEMADWVCRVEGRVTAKFDALRTRAVAAADDAVVASLERCRTTDQLVCHRSRVDPARVRADGRLGRWLADFPLFADALADGDMSRGHLETLRKVDKMSVHQQMVDSQSLFISNATTLDWRDWDRVVGHWLLGADPDGSIPRENRRHRHVSVRKHADGTVTGSFRFDTIEGQLFRRALAYEEQRLLDEDRENGHNRTARQRSADALIRLVGRGAARPDGAMPTPLIHIALGQSLAEDMIARSVAGDYDTPFDVSFADPNWRCELDDGTPVHPDIAMAVLAVCQFKRLVLEPNSRPMNLGRTTRGCPKDIKLAILVAHRGRCNIIGCDAPYAWMQIDHNLPWNKHGETEPENLDPMCAGDNGWKSDTVW